VAGGGPVTTIVVSPLISQLELAWEEPALEHFWGRFVARARVVLSGRRGRDGRIVRRPATRLALGALVLAGVREGDPAGRARARSSPST
jgi:hypothetical protein